jgi:hypothetical protein
LIVSCENRQTITPTGQNQRRELERRAIFTTPRASPPHLLETICLPVLLLPISIGKLDKLLGR